MLSIEARRGTSCITSVDNQPARRHSLCMSSYMHSVFSAQNERGDIVPDWQPPECESDEDDSESADEHNIERDLMVRSSIDIILG